MKKLQIVKLIALILLRCACYIPVAIAKSVGFCYRKEFEINGRIITRPENFKTKAHKAVFERVGGYITDALTRDVLLSFRESSIRSDTFFRYNKMASLEVWREVLQFLENQGCIRHYWSLCLPDEKGRGLYAELPNSMLHNKSQKYVSISEANFERVYYRDRSVLSKENIIKGAKTLQKITR